MSRNCFTGVISSKITLRGRRGFIYRHEVDPLLSPVFWQKTNLIMNMKHCWEDNIENMVLNPLPTSSTINTSLTTQSTYMYLYNNLVFRRRKKPNYIMSYVNYILLSMSCMWPEINKDAILFCSDKLLCKLKVEVVWSQSHLHCSSFIRNTVQSQSHTCLSVRSRETAISYLLSLVR